MTISAHRDTPPGRTLAGPPVGRRGRAVRNADPQPPFHQVYSREHKASLIRIQREQAEAAAASLVLRNIDMSKLSHVRRQFRRDLRAGREASLTRPIDFALLRQEIDTRLGQAA